MSDPNVPNYLNESDGLSLPGFLKNAVHAAAPVPPGQTIQHHRTPGLAAFVLPEVEEFGVGDRN